MSLSYLRQAGSTRVPKRYINAWSLFEVGNHDKMQWMRYRLDCLDLASWERQYGSRLYGHLLTEEALTWVLLDDVYFLALQ
jgi:hypothetical protein